MMIPCIVTHTEEENVCACWRDERRKRGEEVRWGKNRLGVEIAESGC